MAKLIFRYGAMGSSKTADALMVRFNYEERNKNVILLKPKLEKRDGEKIIRSRIGIQHECEYAEDFLDTYSNEFYDAVIVDEVQFLDAVYIDKLAELVDKHDITVICYGLRTDFRSQLFSGSKRLMEIADDIEEIKTICWCGKRAHFNARIQNGIVVTEGEQVKLGGNGTYTALCRKHFMLKQICDTEDDS